MRAKTREVKFSQDLVTSKKGLRYLNLAHVQ